jgi:hypothetical protein
VFKSREKNILKICDLGPVILRCNHLACCDLAIKTRGCYPEIGGSAEEIYRSKLRPNANFDKGRKAWFNNCRSYVKTNFPNAPYNGTISKGKHVEQTQPPKLLR